MMLSQELVPPHNSGAMGQFLELVTHMSSTMHDMHDSVRKLDADQEGFPKNPRT